MKCVFCKITAGNLPSYKFWENEDFYAILDIYPNVKGMSLVVSKEHITGDVFKMREDVFLKLFKAVKVVGGILVEKLNVKRTALVSEGMGIDHAHIKLYPLHGLKDKFEPMVNEKTIFFEKYEGYITSLMGPKAKTDDMKKLVQTLRL